MTSYKVMVSNDSHTWVTVKNGSGDMVSPLTMPWGSGCQGSPERGGGHPASVCTWLLADSVPTQTNHSEGWMRTPFSMP